MMMLYRADGDPVPRSLTATSNVPPDTFNGHYDGLRPRQVWVAESKIPKFRKGVDYSVKRLWPKSFRDGVKVDGLVTAKLRPGKKAGLLPTQTLCGSIVAAEFSGALVSLEL